MPSISQKALNAPASPIRKLVPFADAAKQRGMKVYHLNIGQPDIKTPKCALDSLRNYNAKVIEYSHSAGNLSYREKLVQYYKKKDINISADEIVITNGGSEAILFALMTCCDEGDAIITPEPYYTNYKGFASMAGVKIKPVSSSIDQNFALPPASEFEKIITDKTKAILICNPNNPTGYLYSKKEIEALGEIVQKHGIYLLVDEVYREFVYDGEKFFSVMNLKGLENNVILLDSISKRYSACGARIGMLISKNTQVIQNALKFAQARLSPPSLGQYIAEAAVDTPDEYFEEVLAEYTKRRDVLIKELSKIEGIVAGKPGGAFYTIARLPLENAEDFCKWLLTDFEYNNQTVMLAPAEGFYETKGLGKDEVRIAYVLNVDDLKNAVECLRIALDQYKLKQSS